MLSTNKYLRFLMLCIGLGLLSSCSVNPATGGIDVGMSESTEIKKGKELHEKMLESMPIYQDKKLQAYVNEIGQRLAKYSDRPDIAYHFTIIDSPDINAFALPGGYIYINRGLITYLNTEAELAAVLAHEIAHVTARHAARQKTARTGTGVLSVLAVLTTGSTVIGETAELVSNAAVSGYGRSFELEADRFGAEYLYNAGYSPEAMIEVIGVLKDQEKYARFRARETGQKPKTYHGVFATHPRNDQRLQEAVTAAGSLDTQSNNLSDSIEQQNQRFREHTEGLIIGANTQLFRGEPATTNRYTHNRLGFTIIFPDEWEVDNQRNNIVATAPDKMAQITLGIDLLKENIPPYEYIRTKLDVDLLNESEKLVQYGLFGHTGTVTGDHGPERIGVFYQGRRVYSFRGERYGATVSDIDYSELFLQSMKTFRPIKPGSYSAQKPKTLHYVKANDKTTYAVLSHYLQLGDRGEEQLRLLNGDYPRGEPTAGEWIKIIK